jgi:dipeptidyl-peptidase-4
MSEPSFPRQYGRTRRFSLGVPRNFVISPDGGRVFFLRSRSGSDPLTCLWELDGAGKERLVADPGVLLGGSADEVSPQERVRRERAREQSTGIVAYATDQAVRLAAFALSGRLWVADLDRATARELAATGPVIDPRPDPAGAVVGYVAGGAVRVITADGHDDRALAAPEGPDVSYGLPDHEAAESMERHRGFWWAPDGSRILAARVDTTRVQRWYIADPADPAAPPVRVPYPRAGTANPDVSLWILGMDGSRVAVDWDRAAFEYFVAACWDPRALLIVVQSRNQRTMRILEVDPVTGTTTVRREDTDAAWVACDPRLPALTASGDLVWTVDRGQARRLLVGDQPVTPPDLQVRRVLDVDGEIVLFTESTEPTEIHLWTYSATAGLVRLSEAPGVYGGRQAGGTTVMTAESLGHEGTRVSVCRDGKEIAALRSYAETPALTLRVELLRAGRRELRTAVQLPSWHEPGSAKLPVLMAPYGGPGGQLALAARTVYLVSRWFAEQGFAVVTADGRGTPGRGPDWERTIRGDLAGPVLQDQVDALHAVAERFPDLDLTRVGIRGWSFGGYLAALAVLRRPDVFHAAVAGAPVTDHRLYDTYWKERFLGHPDEEPENYDRCSLIGDASRLEGSLMLIHGLADDNVLAAHTLRLSSALLAAGRPHTVLPLPGATHMVTQEDVAANLLLLQLDFFKRALGITPDRSGSTAVPA